VIDGMIYNETLGRVIAIIVIDELDLSLEAALRLELITYEEWCHAWEWLSRQ
jgi:hypothetical protein